MDSQNNQGTRSGLMIIQTLLGSLVLSLNTLSHWLSSINMAFVTRLVTSMLRTEVSQYPGDAFSTSKRTQGYQIGKITQKPERILPSLRLDTNATTALTRKMISISSMYEWYKMMRNCGIMWLAIKGKKK